MVRTSSNHTVASQSFKEHRPTFVRRFVIPGPRCPTAGRTSLLYSFSCFPTSRRPLFRRPLSVRECKGKRFFRTTKFYFQKVFSKIKSGTIPLPLLHSQRTFPVKRAAKIQTFGNPPNKILPFFENYWPKCTFTSKIKAFSPKYPAKSPKVVPSRPHIPMRKGANHHPQDIPACRHWPSLKALCPDIDSLSPSPILHLPH